MKGKFCSFKVNTDKVQKGYTYLPFDKHQDWINLLPLKINKKETKIKRLYNIKEEDNVLKMKGEIVLQTKEYLEYVYSMFWVKYPLNSRTEVMEN